MLTKIKLYPSIICILCAVFYSACSSDMPVFDSDTEPPLNIPDKSYYAKYATNWDTYKLKGKVKTREVIYLRDSQWDEEKYEATNSIIHYSTLYEFDENGVQTNIKGYNNLSSSNIETKMTLDYCTRTKYDSIYRVTEYTQYTYSYDDSYKNIIDSTLVYLESTTYDDNNKKANVYSYRPANDWYDKREYNYIIDLDKNGRMKNNYDSQIAASQTRSTAQVYNSSLEDMFTQGQEYKIVEKYDTKENIIESLSLLSYVNSPDNSSKQIIINNYQKIKINYYDNPAAETGGTKERYEINPTYKAISLSDPEMDLKGPVKSMTLTIPYTYTEDKSETGFSSRNTYLFDKKGIKIEEHSWRAYSLMNDEFQPMIQKTQKYAYDSKLRITSRLIKEYTVRYNEDYGLTSVLSQIKREEIKYDDVKKEAVCHEYRTYVYNNDDEEYLAYKIIHKLNDEGYIVNNNYMQYYVRSSQANNGLSDTTDLNTIDMKYNETVDAYGNWTERYISQFIYNNAGILEQKLFNYYKTRVITYY